MKIQEARDCLVITGCIYEDLAEYVERLDNRVFEKLDGPDALRFLKEARHGVMAAVQQLRKLKGNLTVRETDFSIACDKIDV